MKTVIQESNEVKKEVPESLVNTNQCPACKRIFTALLKHLAQASCKGRIEKEEMEQIERKLKEKYKVHRNLVICCSLLAK